MLRFYYISTNLRSHLSEEAINEAYEKIVLWRKIFFRLPSNKVGKQFIDEIFRLRDTWSFDSSSKNIAINSVMLLPDLFLQNS